MISSMSIGPDYAVTNGEMTIESPEHRAARAFPIDKVERRHLEAQTKKDLVAIAIRYQQLYKLAMHDKAIQRDTLSKELYSVGQQLRLQRLEAKRWEERLDRVLKLQPILE